MARLIAIFPGEEAMQQAMQALRDAGFAPEQIPAGQYAETVPQDGTVISLDTRGHEPDARSICLRAGAIAFHDLPDPVTERSAGDRVDPVWLKQEEAIATAEGDPAASTEPHGLGSDGVDSPIREIRVTEPGTKEIADLMRRGIGH